LPTSACFSQKLIVITAMPKSVPEGKKWVLPTNRELLIEVSHGSNRSGTMCNSILSSSVCPYFAAEGEYARPNESYSIVFSQLAKVPYTNDYTYSIVPISAFNSKRNDELNYRKPNEIDEKEIIFYPSQKVSVGTTCLQSIQVLEYDLSIEDVKQRNKKIESDDLPTKNESSTESVFIYVEESPKPSYDLDSYFRENLQYPESAKINRIEGRVIVRMIVNEDGRISNAQVTRGLDDECEQEALRLVRNMPKWQPGKQFGRPVKVYSTATIYFRLP
jgi:TonB family protein